MIQRLCVIGVGLIGGSVAAAARARGLAESIVGADADAGNLEEARALGVIDAGFSSIAEAAADSDLIVLATPVGAAGTILEALRPVWSETAVYTDVGSTKRSLVEAAERVFGIIPSNLVPGHPIAGAERSGVTAARPDLYDGRRVILTPLPGTSAAALDRVERFWTALGARVSNMEPGHHDEILAATSHLPHVLAFVLTEMLGRQDERQEIFQYAAGGFRDFTRIASSDPTMWLDICLANREAILPLIDDYRGALRRAAELLAAGDAAALYDLFARAREARQRFLDQLEK
jgi:prephenate dehydrogenase